ncbi:MAG TPA: hypothetical protein VKE96_23930 [Vicinamibacterales bacterium]|nr:hypothetical protein [Vicinamibacterales bacterium]
MMTDASALSTFEHRRSCAGAEGRDKWTVRLVNENSNIYATSAVVLRAA